MHNLYGPTEAAVDVTGHRVRVAAGEVPIGRPVANTEVYVLDRRLRPVPVGVAGELYLAGVQLADGYLSRPDLTADRFVANPYAAVPGARMYRTGDLVRWGGPEAAGELEYLGRTDFQIKIRGQRVELGEIEAVVREAPGIAGAVAVARPIAGSAAVVVYARPDTGTPAAGADDHPDAVRGPDDVLAWCRRRLPSHMVPAAAVVLESFPVNASGKLDRSALPAPADRETVFSPARSPVERTVAALVAELVGRDRVSMRDNVFALGADSLGVARLVSRARIDHGLSMTLTEVFDSVDIGDLARRTRPVGGAGLPELVPVAPAERPALVPLSAAQTRLWFINRMDPAAGTYNMPGAVRLGSTVDVAALEAAIGDLLERHEPLRTRFPSVGGEPHQDVQPPAGPPGALRPHRVAGALDDAILAAAAQGFDLVNETGFRARLLVHDSGYVLVVVVHHIVADGASLRPLIGDLVTAYAARRAGHAPRFAPLPVSYADYALWQQRVLGTTDEPSPLLAAELDFWRDELAGVPEVLTLPTDRPRPRVSTGHGAYLDVEFDADLVDRIGALAHRTAVTPFTVIHAALALELARRSATDDIVIGTAIAGRDLADLDDLVGMFVNTVVLRTRIGPALTVTDLLRAAHRVRARAMEHAIPFERVVDAVAPHRSLAHAPLFQIGLTMQADPAGTSGTDLEFVDARVPAAKYDLALTVTDRITPDGHRYAIEIAYSTDLFDESTVRTLAVEWRRILEQMVAAPTAPIGTIDLLPPDQVRACTRTPDPAAPAATLPDLLRAGAAAARPSAQALSGAVTMTWAVFEARTNQLARQLRARGAGPGQIVAISIPRSDHSVMATVAVAKTGAAFVTIDPRYPDDRRAAMLADSGATSGITVTGVELPATGPSDSGPDRPVDWLCLDDVTVELEVAGHRGAPLTAAELTRPIELDDPAYLIYTSGSTGRPKAVTVAHRGLATMCAAQRAVLGLTSAARVLHVASPSFDASVFELLMALTVGAELVVSPADVYAGGELETLIDTHRVTHVVMTPAALATVEPVAVPTLHTVISVGEACPPDLLARWAAADRAFYNLYGPTEVTIWATAAGPLAGADTVPIGAPIDGVGALVLDHGLRPVPDGVVGELYLAGSQLALGYHRRAALTAERFVANPYDRGGRLYRTGDRVSRTPSGVLIYHGRNDFQLKIRGLRIEPGEVDAVVMAHPAIAGSLSIGVPGPAGDTVLVSYVTGASGATGNVTGASGATGNVTAAGDHRPQPQQVIDFVADRLPGHMVPHTVIVVDRFTLTPAGKIDRAALPAVEFARSGDFVPPRSQLEALVADIFVAVLGLDRVSVTDGFFDLGGNSLSAARVTTRLAAALDHQVPVKELFEAPTVAGLAARLVTSITGHAVPPLTARSRAEMVPVSTVQRGMWLLNRANPDSAAYNVALALRMTGDLDPDALQQAVADLVRRHESLRTSYPMINGEPIQVIVPAEVLTRDLAFTGASGATGNVTRASEATGNVTGASGATGSVTVTEVGPAAGALDAAIADVTRRGFDITAAAPLRLALLRVAADDHVLVFVVHHISADGASMAPLARDLMTAYAARSGGRAPGWRPLPVQYADYTLWQAEKLSLPDADGVTEERRQLDYWLGRLGGAPEILDIPADRPRPRTPSHAGAAVEFEIPAELVTALESVARTHQTTLFMVMHAAFAVLLARITGRDDIVIGTPFAGRGDHVLEDVVGMFVNTLALRTRVSADEPFHTLLERVRAEDLTDMANTDVSFESIVSQLLDVPPTAYNPVFQVMFAFQNIEFPTVELAGLRVEPVDEQLVSAKVDLQLTIFPTDPTGTPGLAEGAIKGQFVYATDLFDAATVETIAARLRLVLAAIADDPACTVGDIVIHTAAESTAVLDRPGPIGVVAGPGPAPDPLPSLVARAAELAADAEALRCDGVSTSFAQIQDLATTMLAVLPDADADTALTMALMTGVPGLVAAGPDALDDALGQLRANAVRVLDAGVGLGLSEGSTRR
ncbi:MAG: amino acid adenylation domain-containing protein [Gordonia sp. (in: high G+C Gram-positive bacteria)]